MTVAAMSSSPAGGVQYDLTSLKLAPHETRAIDIRQLRDAQVADFKKNRIPAGATDGAINWVRLDNVPVMGRVAVITKSGGIASSYDCCICVCPASYDYLDAAPDAFSFLPGDTEQLRSTAYYVDCNYQLYTYDETLYSQWNSANTAVATVNGTGLSTAVAGGSTGISAALSGPVYEVEGSYGDQYCVVAYYANQSDSSAGIVVQITGPNTVWWFNGQNPSGYSTTITLTAQPAGGSSYYWSVVAGTDKAFISSYPSGNQANIVGNSWSTSQGDVTVQCQVTADGVTGVASIDLTVRGPYKLVPGNINDQADPNFGYESIVNYTVEDNLGQTLPSGVGVNEYFSTSPVYDYPGANWIIGPAGGFVMPNSAFADYIQGQAPNYYPSATTPQSTLSPTAVQHWGQDWYVGSTTPGLGAPVQTDTLQKYIDHARHLSISSPAP